MKAPLLGCPKTRLSDELREALKHIKISTRASYVDHGLFVGRYDTVLLHFFVTGVRKQSEPRLRPIRRHP